MEAAAELNQLKSITKEHEARSEKNSLTNGAMDWRRSFPCSRKCKSHSEESELVKLSARRR